jgi:hypothetical protein
VIRTAVEFSHVQNNAFCLVVSSFDKQEFWAFWQKNHTENQRESCQQYAA